MKPAAAAQAPTLMMAWTSTTSCEHCGGAFREQKGFRIVLIHHEEQGASS